MVQHSFGILTGMNAGTPFSASDGNPASPDKEERSKRKQDEEEERVSKQRIVVKAGKIENDKFLMDIAHDIGNKWEEVGVTLGVDYKVLRSVVGSETTKAEHMRAFYMLQEWKGRAAEKFTYKALASALEVAGLNTCARDHCYISLSTDEN